MCFGTVYTHVINFGLLISVKGTPLQSGHVSAQNLSYGTKILYRLVICLNIVVYLLNWEKRCRPQGSPVNV